MKFSWVYFHCIIVNLITQMINGWLITFERSGFTIGGQEVHVMPHELINLPFENWVIGLCAQINENVPVVERKNFKEYVERVQGLKK